MQELIHLVVQFPSPLKEANVSFVGVTQIPVGAQGMTVNELTKVHLALLTPKVVTGSVDIHYEGFLQGGSSGGYGISVNLKPGARAYYLGISEDGSVHKERYYLRKPGSILGSLGACQYAKTN